MRGRSSAPAWPGLKTLLLRLAAVSHRAHLATPPAAPTRAGAPASPPGAGGKAGGVFMGALADLKPGLTDDQKRKAAVQREQLKRDLEEQVGDLRPT